MKLLAEIQKRTSEVLAKYLIIEGDVRPGERFLGTLPEDLLRLYGLHLQMSEELESLEKRHLLVHLDRNIQRKEYADFHDQLHWKKQQHETLMRFFWTAVRYEFGVLNDNIGVRVHGQVVTWRDDAPPKQVPTKANAPSRRSCAGTRTRARPHEQ